jgi:hypothetical protein
MPANADATLAKILKILDAVTLAPVLMYYRCNAKLGGKLTRYFPMTF